MEQRLEKTISLILMKSNSVKEECDQAKKKTKQCQGDGVEGPSVFSGMSELHRF